MEEVSRKEKIVIMGNTNQVALVTGASKGIGRAITAELLRSGYSVVGVSRNIVKSDPELQSLAAGMEVQYFGFQADISKDSDHRRIYNYLNEQFGSLHVLVHNAGIAPTERTDVLEMSAESYFQVMQTNLNGPVFLTQTLLPLLSQVDSGSLVFISSISAEVASINRAEYCISKAGLSMFAKVMAQRLAQTRLSVFEIRPGIIQTDMTAPVLEKYEKLISEGLVPQQRMGQPEDIAKAVRALISGDFQYAHGSCIEVSGGMQIRSL